MTTEQFWKMIEQSRMSAAEGGDQIAFLEQAIAALPPREMVSFEGTCWDLLSLSLKRELWAAATIIQPSCSQGSFDSLRAWMILEGKEFFDQASANPERLADRVPRGRVAWLPSGEMLARLVPCLYTKHTGEEMPTIPRKVPYILKGRRWTEQELPEMYPELWKKYRA